MKTLNYYSKHILLCLFAAFLIGTQKSKGQDTLVPDQNPNYKKSQEKYMAKKDELTKNEGATVQATYKAIDDMELKQERKDLRKSNRQDRRLARINNRVYYYGSPNCNYNYNYPYNNRNYSGYNNYNNYSPYGRNNYNPYNYSRGCAINSFNNVALWGLGAYMILHH